MNINLSSRLKAFLLLINLKFGIFCVFFSVLFLLLASATINIKNIYSISNAPYPFTVKATLLFYIIWGVFSAVSPVDVIFLIITAGLFGLNMGIIASKLSIMKKQGKLGIVFGAGAVSLISAGCAACGLSLLSVVGLGSVLAFLPFHGIEFYAISIGILIFCLYLNLGAYAKACRI